MTFASKLETSDSLNKWNYIVKNLVILDHCVDNRYYLTDIANLKLKKIENY